MREFDFAMLEHVWVSAIEEALGGLVLPRGEQIYALAFWLFYAETGAVIYAPAVGLGCERSWERKFGDEGRDAGFGSARWNPADWQYDVLEIASAATVNAAYRRLGSYACGGIDPEEARRMPHDPAGTRAWEEAFERSVEVVVAVCREITNRVRARRGIFASLPFTDDFVAVVCDPAQGANGERWLAACVDEPLRSRLFSNLESREEVARGQ